MKYVVLLVGTALFLTWFFSDSNINRNNRKEGVKNAIIHHAFDKPNVIEAVPVASPPNLEDALDSSDYVDDEETISKDRSSNFSRPFQYLGDIDPTSPMPWPKEEADWWILHETLVQRVKESDNTSPKHLDVDYLPQLVFYGDSITEGWNGTSFGNPPGPTRMWGPKEPEKIRNVFSNNFGETSSWGKRAILPPLILGISGSRTYDFIWRIENGEFPTSKLTPANTKNEDSFNLKTLERIYIVLMGTNNLGGGMLPASTIAGMDASGRRILELHEQYSPGAPAAILFSELLPRKDDHRAVKMCPPRCANLTSKEPYTSFMPAVDKVNKALPTLLKEWIKDFPSSRIILLSSQHDDGSNDDKDSSSDSGVTIIRCGHNMFSFEDDDDLAEHMPDRLHPNAKGYDLWARCLKRGLEEIMDHTIDLFSPT